MYAGAMKDSIDALRMGVLIMLPELDDHGRAIIFYDSAALVGASLQVEEVRIVHRVVLSPLWSRRNSASALHFCTKEITYKMLRVWWYLTHVAMEDRNVARNGFVLLGDGKHANTHK